MSFAQREDEFLYEAWERFKDLLRLCPHHGLQKWMVVQIFYNGVTQPVRSMIETPEAMFKKLCKEIKIEFISSKLDSEEKIREWQRKINNLEI